MDREEIKKILPHREPMLLIDHALLVDGVSTAIYNVRGDEFFLQGHFPGNPVVPGVILCEMMAQSACLLVSGDAQRFTPYFTSMDKIRFKSKVHPGDCLTFKTQLVNRKGPFCFVKCEGYVDGKLCVSGELSFAIVEGE